MRKPFRISGRDGWHAEVKFVDGHVERCSFAKHEDAETWLSTAIPRAKEAQAPAFGGPSGITLGRMLGEYAARFTLVKGGYKAEIGRINHYVVAAGLPRLDVKVDAAGARTLERMQGDDQPAVPKGFKGHLDARLGRRAKTYQLIAALAAKTVSAVKTDDIRNLHTTMLADCLSPSTAQKEIALLKAAFNSAIREWKWKGFENPCLGIKLGKSIHRFVRLGEADMARVVKALSECDNPQFWPLVDLAIHTTQRKGTLLKLTWDNINLDTREARVFAKGRWADAQFSTRAIQVLRSIPRNGTNQVFTMSENAVNMAWEGVRDKAGLPNLTFRDLRHVGATAYAKAGVSPHVLKGILLHTTTRMAEVYVNLAHSDIQDALDAVDGKLSCLTPLPATADPDGPKKHPRERKSTEAPEGNVFRIVFDGKAPLLVPADEPEADGAVLKRQADC
jgi:integrase